VEKNHAVTNDDMTGLRHEIAELRKVTTEWASAHALDHKELAAAIQDLTKDKRALRLLGIVTAGILTGIGGLILWGLERVNVVEAETARIHIESRVEDRQDVERDTGLRRDVDKNSTHIRQLEGLHRLRNADRLRPGKDD
jgi:hypothetical protein